MRKKILHVSPTGDEEPKQHDQVPTRFYKTGVLFMAYFNDHQGHFVMGGAQRCTRSIVHLAEISRRAARTGFLKNPEKAETQTRRIMAVQRIAV